MKEIWFRTEYNSYVSSKQLRRTFRELPEEWKNNSYLPGEDVLCKIHDGYGKFFLEEYVIKIENVELRQIESLLDGDFRNSDAKSREDLKEKMARHYKKNYSGKELVRIIDFSYTENNSKKLSLEYCS